MIHCRSITSFLFILFILPAAMAQQVFTPIDDSYIYAGGPKAADAYGLLNPDTLKTRKSVASEEFTRETYVMFRIGSFDTTFSTVVVKLYGTVVEAKRTQVYYCDTLWQEETLTGNNRPSGTYITDIQLAAGTGYAAWDVTRYVNMAVKEGRQTLSFVFKDVAGAISTKDTPWHSRENPSGKAPLLELTPGPEPYHRTGAYYVDAIGGDDANTAESPQQAWQTLERVNAEYFGPGDSVLFKCNSGWVGQLAIRGSGSRGKPIVIGSYGTGAKPLINGNGEVTSTVQLTGQHHVEIQDLHVTNFGQNIEFRRGIYVRAEDMGVVEHIILRRLEVSDVNGVMEPESAKNNGGVIFEISGSARETWFDTLVVEDCYIHDVDRTGMANTSTWDSRTLTTSTSWVPSRNIIIRNNTFERTGANALIVRVAEAPLMEHNLFTHCAIKGSGNACFNFNTNGAVWQYNEARFTKFNAGDEDAGGFDSDYKSINTLIQYNYSHDNDWGAVLLTGGPGSSGGFNDGTVIRYNLFVNNKHHQIKTSGKATNSLIYNNTIYNRPTQTGIVAIWHKSWDGFSDGTTYNNNIFHVTGTGAGIDLGGSSRNVFDYNIFYGSKLSGVPQDEHILRTDPMFTRPDSAGNGADTIGGYRLKPGSPAINAGMQIAGAPEVDIEGNAVPFGDDSDRGAFEYLGPFGADPLQTATGIRILPNPTDDIIRIDCREGAGFPETARFYTMEGKMLAAVPLKGIMDGGVVTLSLEKMGLPRGYLVLRCFFSDRSAATRIILFRKNGER